MAEEIKRLLRDNPCRHQYRYHCFMLHGPPTIRLRGLLPFLQDFAFEKDLHCVSKESKAASLSQPAISTGQRIRVRPVKPIVLGRRVDRELHSLCTTKSVSTGVGRKRKRKQKSGTRFHLHTQVYLLYWQAKGAFLVASQVPVACRHKKIGTAIDQLLLVKRTGQLLVVELKNSSLARTKCVGAPVYFQSPFDQLQDLPLNRFLLQLACTFVMFQQTFPLLAQRSHPALLVLDQKTQQVLRYDVPPSTLDLVRNWLA